MLPVLSLTGQLSVPFTKLTLLLSSVTDTTRLSFPTLPGQTIPIGPLTKTGAFHDPPQTWSSYLFPKPAPSLVGFNMTYTSRPAPVASRITSTMCQWIYEEDPPKCANPKPPMAISNALTGDNCATSPPPSKRASTRKAPTCRNFLSPETSLLTFDYYSTNPRFPTVIRPVVKVEKETPRVDQRPNTIAGYEARYVSFRAEMLKSIPNPTQNTSKSSPNNSFEPLLTFFKSYSSIVSSWSPSTTLFAYALSLP